MDSALRTPILALLILVGAAPAGAGEREWHRYRTICEKLSLDKFAALPEAERDRLDIRIKLSPAEGPQVPVTLTIVAAAGRIVVVPGADGLSEFPVRAALLAENPVVLTSVPEPVKTRVSLELGPRLPAAQEPTFAYADLMRSVEQANRAIKSAAGFFSFAAPKMKGVVLHFSPGDAPVTARLGGADGRLLKADPAGRLELPMDDNLLAGNPVVVLSARPISASFIE
jgi:hypothetical protein